MAMLTRGGVLAAPGALGAGSVLSLGYALRSIFEAPAPRICLTDGGGFMGAGPVDISRYIEMFNRHNEINRVVEEIPGVRTTTESNSPELATQLRAHVSSMYSHLDQGAEISCMSQRTIPSVACDERHCGGTDSIRSPGRGHRRSPQRSHPWA